MMQEDLGRQLRVKWEKGANMLASFYRDLGEVRRAIGDEALPGWCISHLGLGISVISRVSGILSDADAAIEKDNLRRAKEAEREANRLKREARAKQAAEQRRLREAAKAPSKKRRPGGSRTTTKRQRMIDRIAIAEVREAVAAGRVSISKGADIAGQPADMQPRLLDVALAKSRRRQPEPAPAAPALRAAE